VKKRKKYRSALRTVEVDKVPVEAVELFIVTIQPGAVDLGDEGACPFVFVFFVVACFSGVVSAAVTHAHEVCS
jgi:hypothetical protein